MKNYKKMILVVLPAVIVLILSGFFIWKYLSSSHSDWKDGGKIIATINKTEIILEVSSSPIRQIAGLSGRSDLKENEGMLFVFKNPEILNFWMKDMLLSLDFIWIDGDQIVDLSQNILPPEKNGKVEMVHPQRPADKVIEANAGFISKNNIKIGDKVIFPN